MAVGPPDLPPYDPWHRRYWGYYNRPYTGCGCVWTILVLLLVWWIIALIWAPGWWYSRFWWWKAG